MSSVIYRLLYALFPRRCKLCGEVVSLDEELCSECRKAKRITGKICHKCGREVNGCICKEQKFSPGYQSFCAPYYFEGSRKNGVYRLKNSGFRELAPAMAEEIAAAVKLRFKDVVFDAVTFVPMRPARERKRGYNQGELLANEVAKLLGAPCEPLLKKVKNTHSQRKSDAAARKVNLYGAFDVIDPEKVKDKTVLIVDDVKTTGYSLSECAVMLNIYQAKAVYAAAFTVTNQKRKK